MLIRFTVENFLSFDDRQSFSMISGKGTLKSHHKSPKIFGVSVLKTAVLFGANASGKSNLVKAISFGRKLIVKGVKAGNPILYQNFRLNNQSKKKDSRIEYEFQHKEENYAYGFVFNKEKIVEEWLYKVGKSGREIKVFERGISTKDSFDLDYLIRKNNGEEEKQFLRFTAKGTPDNQLFLNEIRTRKVQENVSNIEDLLIATDWFKNSLKVIFPDDKYNEGLKFELKQDDQLLESFEEFLAYFDTGIDGVGLERVKAENIEIPNPLINKIKEDLMNKKSENIRASILSNKNTTYFLSIKNDELVIEKFITKHKVKGTEEIEKFDTSNESDGTNRIMDFIPILLDLLKGDNVFIIDEMERSLHPNLIYDLLDLFLSKAKNINSQMILASHESTLMTQDLLRKDEIWFVVKDQFGASRLHSLEEYNVRFDKKIRKDYLLGRFKAIPRIGNRNKLSAYNL